MLSKHLQLSLRNAVSPPGFHGKFLHRRKIKQGLQPCQKPVHLLRLQGGRRTAADIDSIQNLPPAAFCRIFQLPNQTVNIGIYKLSIAADRKGGKGAVQAGCGAERNSNIETVSIVLSPLSVVADRPYKRPFPPGNIHGKLCFFRTDIILFPVIFHNFPPAFSFFQQLIGNLCRANSREISPGKRPSCCLTQHTVQEAFKSVFEFLILCEIPMVICPVHPDGRPAFFQQNPDTDIRFQAFSLRFPHLRCQHADLFLRIESLHKRMHIIFIIRSVQLYSQHLFSPIFGSGNPKGQYHPDISLSARLLHTQL